MADEGPRHDIIESWQVVTDATVSLRDGSVFITLRACSGSFWSEQEIRLSREMAYALLARLMIKESGFGK